MDTEVRPDPVLAPMVTTTLPLTETKSIAPAVPVTTTRSPVYLSPSGRTGTTMSGVGVAPPKMATGGIGCVVKVKLGEPTSEMIDSAEGDAVSLVPTAAPKED